MSRRVLLLLAAAAVLAAAWGWSDFRARPRGAGPLTVCAGLFPLYDWARRVAGPDAEVTALSGGGGDPHHFAPSLEDITRIGRARVLLVVGLGMEPWARRAVESEGGAGQTELLEVGTWVARRPLRFPHSHGDEEEGHAEAEAGHAGAGHAAADDPHVWLDPVRAAQIVTRLGGEFARLDPAHAEGYRARAAAYAAELNAFAAELPELGRMLAGRKVVVFHDAYGYLFERLGLEVAGVVETGAGAEPSARDVAEAAQRMRALGQRNIFAEAGHQAAAQALAETLGGRVVVLDHLTALEAPGGRTYLERLRYNVKALVENLP